MLTVVPSRPYQSGSGYTGEFQIKLTIYVSLLAAGLLPAPAVHAQSALDGFDPNANGAVQVVVVQPDGKILLGGNFTTLSPNGGASVTRNRIARLNADGTLDTTFNPNANASVQAIALQADGKILVGGSFNGANSIGGQPRNRIARLDAVTGLADSFDPSATGPVSPQIDALALQADGKILAGGLFTSIGGQTRTNIARLDPTTGLADSFDPNANNQVISIAVQGDGRVLAGGQFTGIGGQTRSRIARLDATTGLADSWNPNANSTVITIAVQADGKILAGGFFQSGFGTPTIGGQNRNRIARLDPATGAADSFNPNANNFVRVIAVQPDGGILVGGDFTGANSIGGAARNNIARLNPVSGLADSFNPGANLLTVFALAQQPDGKVLAGGIFTAFAPNGGTSVTRNRIARLTPDGRVDQTLGDPAIIGTRVGATAIQPDGKILIGGLFNTVLGVSRRNIARLNSDGTLDTAFDPNANGAVQSIALQTDGKILVGGQFNGTNSIGGQTRNRIARLDPTTGAADSWNPNANQPVAAIAVQADGKILVGGQFGGTNSIGGQMRNHIARLDPATGFADAFNPNAQNEVATIAVQADGKIVVAGFFLGANSIGGQTRNFIARLDSVTGAVDPAFDPNADGNVFSLAIQADGKILAGGTFFHIGGQPRTDIGRLDPITGAADSFDPNPNAFPSNAVVHCLAVQADGKILVAGGFTSIGGQMRNTIARLDATSGLADSFDPSSVNSVFSIALQADGKILVGGDFTNIGSQPRSFFARLTNDAIAMQKLDVRQTSATWFCSGSGPQFTHVTFEDSIDDVNFNFLGTGTTSGSNWIITGLNLSIQQNLYIRARGYYRSGDEDASESITESVRNAFIVPVPVLNILSVTRTGNGHTILQCVGVPNQVNDLRFSPDLSQGSFQTVSPLPAAADGTGAFQYDDAGAVGLTRRFYLLAYP